MDAFDSVHYDWYSSPYMRIFTSYALRYCSPYVGRCCNNSLAVAFYLKFGTYIYKTSSIRGYVLGALTFFAIQRLYIVTVTCSLRFD